MSEYSQEAINKVDAYLEHHGILGQKWGVKHGPPYPLDSKTSKKVSSGKVTINVKDLSDDDLRKIINRLQMEKQLKDLTAETKTKGQSVASKVISKIGNAILDTGVGIGSGVAKKIGTQVLTYKIGAEINKKMGADVIDLGKKKDKDK